MEESKSNINTLVRTLIGTLITLVSLFSGFYFYLESQKERNPTFIVDPVVTTLIDRDLLKDKPLNISDRSGKPINQNVIITTFYFFNQGQESIKKENVLEGIQIKISGNAKILDFKILKRSRSVTHLELTNYDSSKNTIDIGFKILESEDGLTGQIMYLSDEPANLNIKGVVEGVKEFSSSYAIAGDQTTGKLSAIFLLLAAIILPLEIINWLRPVRKQKKRFKTIQDRLTTRYQLIIRNEDNIVEKSTFGFTYAKLLLMSAALFIVVFMLSLVLSKTLLFKNVNFTAQKSRIEIPSSIIP